MLIDTHAHLFWENFDKDLDEVIGRAKNAGVNKIVAVGVNYETSKECVEIAKKYPDRVRAAAGIHPGEISTKDDLEKEVLEMKRLTSSLEVVAIGEIGIDLSTKKLGACFEAQRKLMILMCLMAVNLDLPVIIHTRESLSETLGVLDSLLKMPRGVFHCFSFDEEALREVLERGFYVSFAGNITWSKRVSKLVGLVPDDRLLLETDSPFMVPRKKDGQPVLNGLRNEPCSVKILAEIQAGIRKCDIASLIGYTGDNAKDLFNL